MAHSKVSRFLRKNASAIQVDFISLNFLDKKIEKKFRDDYFTKSIAAFRVSFITVMLLYSAFGLLDYYTSQEFLKSFLIVRYLIVLPVLLGVFLFSFSKLFKKVWQELLSFCYIVGGAGIIFMLLKNPDNLYYYAGMFLIFAAGYFFIKLRFLGAAISGISLIILYNISAFLFQSVIDLQIDYLIATNAFNISANIICMIALYNLEFLLRKDFHQRELLTEAKNEITLINQSLEAKVVERTKLLDERNTNLLAEINIREKVEKELLIAKEKSEESDRLKSAFLANMSHEIRTPMNGILGFTDLLKKPKLSGEEQEKYIGVIESSGQRLLNTVNDLIDISKIEAGLMKVSVSEVNLNKLLEQLFTFFNVETQLNGLQLILSTAPLGEDIVILSDQDKLYSILTNLIKNAIKYTQSGSIDFGFERKGQDLQFSVKDTGDGISNERLGVIFERFIRGEDNKAFSEGSGLGLSISKAYVEMLGGKIWVESEKGVGSQFYFTIPYKTAMTKLTSTKEVSSKAKSQLKDLKILIADDEETGFALLEAFLENVSTDLLRAVTGFETLELCRKNSDIDLILMDINMPEMDGYEATRQIREFNKEVIIIAQTAYAISGDRAKSIQAGCNEYISKPIDKQELLEKMEKCLIKN